LAISSGIDTVINLGAGMDTRPYRMHLPPSLHWVEVDHPILIESKNAQLSTEVPACSIERVGLDLADRDARRGLFDRIWTASTMAIVLTEGVLGDLSVDEAGGLADDLRAQTGCESWVIDYFSPRLLAAYQRHQPHPNVPVRFDPPSWETFFTEHGWRIREIRFLGEESERLHRAVPLSPLDRVMRRFTPRPLRDMGYGIERSLNGGSVSTRRPVGAGNPPRCRKRQSAVGRKGTGWVRPLQTLTQPSRGYLSCGRRSTGSPVGITVTKASWSTVLASRSA
jgi:hypothetical protein